jgi:signal transduction histidine kinase
VRAPATLPALVDSLRLEQVVTNLLDNAIKFSPAGGQIDVELSEPAPGMGRLAVTDHGIGIPPERRQHIFERFYQAHDGDHVAGLGLGLYISRQIVELHGGAIEPEFPPEGGCRFTIDLPTQPTDAVTEIGSGAAAGATPAEGREPTP